MRIMLINNDGGGFADYIEVESNTTIKSLFSKRIGGDAADYFIRVNRQPTTSEYVLQEGDRVSITPVKIEGA
ncbi:MAG: molybdopterin converting factor [Planctomycetes bacterium]|nr:molybdopterin converting factor [Planctomycetota bacterium]